MTWPWNPGNEYQCLEVTHIKTTFSLFRIHMPENPENENDYQTLYGNNIAHSIRRMNETRQYMSFSHGICHPSACSSYDMAMIVDIYFNYQIEYEIKNVNRIIKPTPSYVQYISVFVITIIVLINLASTLSIFQVVKPDQ